MDNLSQENANSTIFALATATGRAAVAIMRISGPLTRSILMQLCQSLPQPRQASVRKLWRKTDSGLELLDHALVIWFPGPKSYTGEDSAELQLHAGPAVIEAVADTLISFGARPAQPGEFTRRAFVNGRVDLLQAEAIADLVEAETQGQRRQALEQTEGRLSNLYQGWADRLRNLLAHQEALIDFPDEELPDEVEQNLAQELDALCQEMENHLNDAGRGERLRRGLIFAIIGPPNAGKSSLLNYLADRDAAIVTEKAGTTRDAIEVRIILGDVPVTLVDTAGLRETKDLIEVEGIRRAQKIAHEADCVIYLSENSETPLKSDITYDIWIHTKSDLNVSRETKKEIVDNAMAISVKTGENMEKLQTWLVNKAKALTERQGPPPLTRARHRVGISDCVRALKSARQQTWPELRGEELRLAMQSLGRLTGRVGVEDLLDTIFGQFCIGK